VNGSIFAERDHPVRERTNSFCFGERRLDPTVLDQAANLVREQRFAMFGLSAEPDRFLLMSHRLTLS
jgi:hypothetical protein